VTRAIDTSVIAFGDKSEQHAENRNGDSEVRPDGTVLVSNQFVYWWCCVLCVPRGIFWPPAYGVLSLELQWSDSNVAYISMSKHDVTQCNMVSGKREKMQVGTSGKSKVFVQQIWKKCVCRSVGLIECAVRNGKASYAHDWRWTCKIL
jgi:hypothetical protein